MAPRTTEASLRKLFPEDNGTAVVDHYLADANVLVTDLLGASSLSNERLEIIERYLAAHFYVLGQQSGGVFEEKIGESTVKTGSTFTLGQGLKLTRWGQMALAADTTGALSAIEGGKKKTAQFRLV